MSTQGRPDSHGLVTVKCKIGSCQEPAHKSSYCKTHKSRVYVHGVSSRPTANRSYPLEPIERFIMFKYSHLSDSFRFETVGPTAIMARVLDMSVKSISSMRSRATIAERTADILCCKLGVHISMIYPEYWQIEQDELVPA